MSLLSSLLEKKWNIKSASLLFIILFAIGITANALRFEHDTRYTFQGDVWADRSGYYIYLPSAFIYHMDGKAIPDTADALMGYGFHVTDNGKIYTKYPIGVAYFQLPFYLSALTMNKITGVPNTGVSDREHLSVLWAGVFWGIVGVFLMYRLLLYYTSRKIAAITSAIILLGTNLLYYTVLEAGMSHVYSFLLFTALLWFLKKWKDSEAKSTGAVLGIAASIGLIFTVRQLNLVFALPLLLFFETGNVQAVLQRILLFLKPKTLAICVLVPALIILPQILYYYYISGSPFLYSYQKEGFDHLYAPMVKEVLFAPHNGLFPYSLVLLIAYPALFVMIYKGVSNSILWLAVLLMVLMTYASWWSWELGCAYGHRGHTDLFILFAFVLAWLLTQAENWTKTQRNILYGALTLLVLINLRHVFRHSYCYFGEGDWDWPYYWQRLKF